MRPLAAGGVAAGGALAVTLGAVWWSHITNYWFPWLVIAGGQVPCALVWALASARIRRETQAAGKTIVISESQLQSADALAKAGPGDVPPDAPDYELFDPPFAEGAYGKVWLARNAIGQWQALKAVYAAKFGISIEPYDREFNGIKRYKPVSDKHPGLLRVDFVSRKKRAGHFYYVMELGDALEPGWEENPATYRPRDLGRVRAEAERHRLPLRECLRIGIVLAEALDFLHRHGLTHRDVKPPNIIFVNGHPKLADVGLVAEIRPTEERTWVGTPGFMPPPPEPPGTPQADIYGLGMVLYVTRTGRDPGFFPELSTTLIEEPDRADFLRFNAVIVKACQPERAQRYASAAEMHAALIDVQKALDREEMAAPG
jgi:serine/threonine protein kinase